MIIKKLIYYIFIYLKIPKFITLLFYTIKIRYLKTKNFFFEKKNPTNLN